jgi:hypothetical protein
MVSCTPIFYVPSYSSEKSSRSGGGPGTVGRLAGCLQAGGLNLE